MPTLFDRLMIYGVGVDEVRDQARTVLGRDLTVAEINAIEQEVFYGEVNTEVWRIVDAWLVAQKAD